MTMWLRWISLASGSCEIRLLSSRLVLKIERNERYKITFALTSYLHLVTYLREVMG